MEEIMSKEHELVSLGGQAAAAAHSLGTPFSTIKPWVKALLSWGIFFTIRGVTVSWAKEWKLLTEKTIRTSE